MEIATDGMPASTRVEYLVAVDARWSAETTTSICAVAWMNALLLVAVAVRKYGLSCQEKGHEELWIHGLNSPSCSSSDSADSQMH
jgi:hypothetical protein